MLTIFNFTALMLRYDPDVVVGHDFIGDQVEVLLQRLKELKIEHWSRISRMRRNKSVPLGKQGTNIRLLTGRLICDLTSDAAKVWRSTPLPIADPLMICLQGHDHFHNVVAD